MNSPTSHTERYEVRAYSAPAIRQRNKVLVGDLVGRPNTPSQQPPPTPEPYRGPVERDPSIVFHALSTFVEASGSEAVSGNDCCTA